MLTWADFKAAAPELATEGERLFYRDGIGQALLATVRGDDPPRIHPIYLGVVEGRLYGFILRSPKLQDLEQDGRFALHTHQDPAAPSEFSVRGRAQPVPDEAVRSAVAAGWSFEVDETYGLVEFRIESALLGRRSNADEWPPRYRPGQPRPLPSLRRTPERSRERRDRRGRGCRHGAARRAPRR
jgi:hypothetical protein